MRDQQESAALAAPGSTHTIVRSYANVADYEADAVRMSAQGWEPVTSSGGNPGQIKIPSTVAKAVVFLPWAFLRPGRKDAAITVTWVHHGSTVEVDGLAAGWKPDPTGRHEQRWWTGDQWSAVVWDGNAPSDDPLWP
jgi:hypothetical protein